MNILQCSPTHLSPRIAPLWCRSETVAPRRLNWVGGFQRYQWLLACSTAGWRILHWRRWLLQYFLGSHQISAALSLLVKKLFWVCSQLFITWTCTKCILHEVKKDNVLFMWNISNWWDRGTVGVQKIILYLTTFYIPAWIQYRLLHIARCDWTP